MVVAYFWVGFLGESRLSLDFRRLLVTFSDALPLQTKMNGSTDTNVEVIKKFPNFLLTEKSIGLQKYILIL